MKVFYHNADLKDLPIFHIKIQRTISNVRDPQTAVMGLRQEATARASNIHHYQSNHEFALSKIDITP